MKKWIEIFVVIILIGPTAFGQRVGVNRASIKWRQINTEGARIIFPEGQDSIANRVATLAEELSANHRGTIGKKLDKVDIVIQSENTLSNGYVGLGPYRSELYMTSPQDPFRLGANNWGDQLAIHEFRHAQQFSNFNIGLSKVGTILGGQYGRAVANNLAIPDWFWEGDAIWNETVHTQQGRGRIPFFFNGYKGLDFGGKNYNWMKLRNGSLKDFVPNHYDLGYLLVSHGREKYGDTVWNNLTRDAASFKGLFYPMQKAVKNHLGVATYKEFTDDALQTFKTKWKSENTTPEKWVTGTQKNNVINYRYPYPLEQGGFVALKTSFRQIPTFVTVDSLGNEKNITVKDIGYDDYFGYNNGYIIYTAYQPDARWENREYSVIRVYDMITGELKTISNKTRYFSPDITSDGERIVVVQVNPGEPSQVHILNNQGQVTHAFSADSALFYSHPKWTKDQNGIIVAARKNSGEMGWLYWNIEDNTSRWLLPPAPRLVGFPVIQGDTLVFTNSSNGVDALHAINLTTGTRFEFQQFATGIYQGFIKDGQLFGSVFTAEGYRIAKWQAGGNQISAESDNMPNLFVPKTLQTKSDLTDIPTKQYSSERYRKSFQLFNFHSWVPEPNEPDYTFTLVGENVLSTLNSEIFFNYNTNETSSELGARFTFGDSYVMPFINGSQTWNREVRLNADTTFIYNETKYGGGLLLPLNLSGGKYARSLTLSTAVNRELVNWTGIGKDLLNNQDYTASVSRLTYVAQNQRALQHIYPRFGQTLILDYRSLVDNNTARQFLASGALYFPGFHVNHNLVITAAYQGRDTLRQYFFSNSFPFSRGYNTINYPRQWRIGVNYHFPLFYPDWGFGNILYFRRVRANAFYDYTQGKSLRTGETTPFGTVGGEMFFDMKFWNVQTLTLGVRYSYLLNFDLLEPGRMGLFEIVLPVNLFGR